MGYQPLEKLLPRSNYSVYKLILMASKRATELADGSPPLVDVLPLAKTTTIALDEVMHGKVELHDVAEAREKAQKKSKAKKDET